MLIKPRYNFISLCSWLFFVCLSVSKSLAQKQLTASFKGEDDLLPPAITQGPKTVDVPASLPTPPHNNQEELRYVFKTFNQLHHISLMAISTSGFSGYDLPTMPN